MSLNSIKKFYDIGKKDLFPICRSLTGNGNRITFSIIKRYFPKLRIYETLCNEKVFDWTIPSEWNIEDAYVEDKFKNKIIDFKKNNLHILGYSIPIKKYLKKDDLLAKLHSLPKLPNAIPYLTSYYKKDWGFCLSHKEKKKIISSYKRTDQFKIVINSSLKKRGKLNYAEYFIRGKSKQEILISTYICHPSLANNELSGPIVAMSLINYFKKKHNKKSIRFIFIPETIGSIIYLSKNLKKLKENVVAGYNLTCIGDNRNHSCMLTKYGNTISDKCLIEAYKKLKIKPKIHSFLTRGSDERQYNSPGIDLPIASIFRTKYGHFKEQHSSLDNFELVTPKGIYGGYKVAKQAIKNVINKEIPTYKVLCEPQLGKRGLYPSLSKIGMSKELLNAKQITDFLQFCDGKYDIKEISKIIKVNLKNTKEIFNLLKKKKLINT